MKNAFARRATGVTVVTARAGERIHGMTVSAFAEVSLEPPLVLICIDQSAKTHALIEEGGVFAVNILARGQEALADRFATREEEARFSDLECESAATGAPLLAGCVAQLDCRLASAHESGDHTIFVGEVVGVRLSDGEPLVFYDRNYRGLSD
ncbi:MAG: flavin reductase [Deltaproteobacteria bacterium]|nr:flavin reductase [Deltaproteobacteria bacterium]